MSLKRLRQEKGWSQEQLAEISDVSVRTIQRMEKGEAPRMETAKALAAAFEIPIQEFQELLDANSQDQTTSILQYGWKGVLVNLATGVGLITWSLFLEREFGIGNWITMTLASVYVTILLVHLIHILNANK